MKQEQREAARKAGMETFEAQRPSCVPIFISGCPPGGFVDCVRRSEHRVLCRARESLSETESERRAADADWTDPPRSRTCTCATSSIPYRGHVQAK
jgi:hypothetical protein